MSALGNLALSLAPFAFGIAGYWLGVSVTRYQHRVTRAEYDWYRAETVEHEAAETFDAVSRKAGI